MSSQKGAVVRLFNVQNAGLAPIGIPEGAIGVVLQQFSEQSTVHFFGHGPSTVLSSSLQEVVGCESLTVHIKFPKKGMKATYCGRAENYYGLEVKIVEFFSQGREMMVKCRYPSDYLRTTPASCVVPSYKIIISYPSNVVGKVIPLD